MDTGYVSSVSLDVAIEITFLIGLLTHVFIITVNVINWRKGRTITTCDQVIISIVMSKSALQLFMQILFLLILLNVKFSVIVYIFFNIVLNSIIFSSIWLSTLLSVVLYFKISTLHSGIFLWLKRMITKNVFSLIIAIVLVSTASPLLNSLISFSTFVNSTKPNAFNSRGLYQAIESLYFINHILPFGICLLSSLLLITSLCFHISRMRPTNSSSSLDAYYRTMKYTIVSLFTCALYVCLNILSDFINVFSVEFIFLMWMTCPTLHSMYVIYVTTTLKKPFSMFLRHLKNCLLKTEEPNSIQQIETVTR